MNVTAVDVGVENMGIGYTLGGEIKEIALTTIHITKDKRMFEYEEKQVVPLCWEWVNCYRRFWEKSSLIYIERQMSFHRGKERGCLLIQNSLYSIFLTLYQVGRGPKPILREPTWWKKIVGIQVGDHARGADGHAENKARSIELFKQQNGSLAIDQILRKWGKVDDVADVTHMLNALMIQFDELSSPLFYSNHKEAPGVTRIKKEDRLRRLPSLLDKEEDIDPHHLRETYLEFKNRRRDEKTMRTNDKRIKKSRENRGLFESSKPKKSRS